MTSQQSEPWTGWQKTYATLLVLLGGAITVIAFRVIYDTVTALVRPYMPHWPWSVVVSCEIAFLFLFGVGILLSWRKVPSPVTRGLFMGLLITGSVVLNVWAARGKVPDMMAHLVVVLAFFAVLLTGKAAFQMLRGQKVRADRIGIGEWIAHPIRAGQLQRWMATWGEPSRDVAHARYMQLLYAIAIAQTDKEVGKRPFRWRRNLPVTLRYQFSMGQLPRFDGDDWQTKVADHVEAALHPPTKNLRKAIGTTGETADQPDTGTSSPKPSADTSERTRQRTPNYDRKPQPAAVRKMTPAELAPFVRAWVGQGNPATIKGVVDHFHVGDTKARAALIEAGLWGDDAAVIPLAGSSARA